MSYPCQPPELTEDQKLLLDSLEKERQYRYPPTSWTPPSYPPPHPWSPHDGVPVIELPSEAIARSNDRLEEAVRNAALAGESGAVAYGLVLVARELRAIRYVLEERS